MKSLLQILLFHLAQAVLQKYKPDIVGVTGTIGKTSTRDAIAGVLAARYRIRTSAKNFNNEIGVPLTIIGGTTLPGHSPLRWFGIIFTAVRLLLWKDPTYPTILVLEMGVDRPGDMTYLTTLAPCKVGIVTALSPVHLEQFGTFERLETEKKVMYTHLSGIDRWALINHDDPLLAQEEERLFCAMLTYGLKKDADVRALNLRQELIFRKGRTLVCITGTLTHGDASVDFEIKNVIGLHFVSSILAATAVGVVYHIPLEAIAEQISKYETPKGRMHVVDGINGSLIIDDTYNSSPKAACAALDALDEFCIDDGAQKIAVLGDMRELGSRSESEHKSIGEYVTTKNIDVLVTVGADAHDIANGAHEAGLDDHAILCFDDPISAVFELKKILRSGDVVLVKGSQGIRLEKLVKEIMAHPAQASKLLVRQEKEWI
jgi:UDP-N-acetylmuramoyl-tripeptide--D-alanyl-D-alanine ligase